MNIDLSNGIQVVCDDQDKQIVEQFHWYAVRDGNMIYAYANAYRTEDGVLHGRKPDQPHKATTVKMHRLILDAPRGLTVDHINRDGLDNRRNNLRLATVAQNLVNTGKRQSSGSTGSSTSSYKGVYLHRPTGRWLAQIRYPGEKNKTHLGYFTKEEDAAYAFDKAARTRHVDFEQLNFTWRVCPDQQCVHQGQPQPAELTFPRRRNRPTGFQNICKSCSARQQRERRRG